jgi:hypothetical protein
MNNHPTRIITPETPLPPRRLHSSTIALHPIRIPHITILVPCQRALRAFPVEALERVRGSGDLGGVESAPACVEGFHKGTQRGEGGGDYAEEGFDLEADEGGNGVDEGEV